MRNKYKGTCYRCGQIVDAGAGHFEKSTPSHAKKWGFQYSKWLTQHAECAIKYRDTDVHYKYTEANNDK